MNPPGTPARRPQVSGWYLQAPPTDPPYPAPWHVTLDLTTGDLSIGPSEGTPWPITATWALRWPVAPLPVRRANQLLTELEKPAQQLLTTTRPTGTTHQERPGLILHYGAGPALDTIAQTCATTWNDPGRLPPGTPRT